MSRRKKSDSGFTLLEVLISMALIATALVAVFKLQGQNLDLLSEARFVTLATQLGRERLSQLQMQGLKEGASSGEFGEGFALFTFEEKITRVFGMDHLYNVALRISIPGGSRETAKEQSFETYIYQN